MTIERRLATGRRHVILLHERVLAFAIADADHLPWCRASDARLRIVSEDGAHEQSTPLSEGARTGNSRIFHFHGARPGVRYRGELLFGDEKITLFQGAEIDKVLDPGEQTTHLPPVHVQEV